MYRAPAAALFDQNLPSAQLAAKGETFAEPLITDGYRTSCTVSSTSLVAPTTPSSRCPDKTFEVVAQDPRLLRSDSRVEGPDGTLYITAPHIPEMKAAQRLGMI